MAVYIVTEYVDYEGHRCPEAAFASSSGAATYCKTQLARWVSDWRGRHPEDEHLDDEELTTKWGPDYQVHALEVVL